MATTPSGLPYPVGTDKVVDGDDAIRALAEKLDPYIHIGPIETTGFFTPAANWAVSGGVFARIALGQVQVQLGLNYTGPAISVPGNGNIADTLMGTLSVPYRPAFNAPLVPCGGGPVVAARVTNAGQIALTAVAPGVVLDNTFGTTIAGTWTVAAAFLAGVAGI